MLQSYRQYAPVLSPTSWVHPTAILMGDVFLGEHVSIWPGAVLRGDQGSITIGEESNIQDLSVVHATGDISRTVIGARVTVGHRVILHGCQVMDNCLIGMGSILLDNCVIEPDCIIGAGSLIPEGRRIPRGSLVLGSPGKVIRSLTPRDFEKIRTGCETYKRLKEEYRG